MTAINGTEVRTTNNVKSNAYFTSAANLSLSGTHTLSILYYNTVGPSDMSFAFGYNALPEPGAIGLLLLGGLPAAAKIARRRRG